MITHRQYIVASNNVIFLFFLLVKTIIFIYATPEGITLTINDPNGEVVAEVYKLKYVDGYEYKFPDRKGMMSSDHFQMFEISLLYKTKLLVYII